MNGVRQHSSIGIVTKSFIIPHHLVFKLRRKKAFVLINKIDKKIEIILILGIFIPMLANHHICIIYHQYQLSTINIKNLGKHRWQNKMHAKNLID